MIGMTLSHFRILEKIGEGGMGVVYRALDESLDRDVALKLLPAGSLTDETARRRFRKEALALSRLNHPNIETVHAFETQDGVDFLVMELIPGLTLDEKLAAGPLPEKEIARLGAQLADGLAAAHAEGVVHRDLKPANLRLTPDGRLKILDFGLAKWLQAAGGTDSTDNLIGSEGGAGTLPYMAPEQLRQEGLDPRSDIYAAGAVLYQMATAQRPFPQTSPPRLIEAILSQAAPRPAALNPLISPALESIILKALDKDPERRYQKSREMFVDLERLREPSSPVAGPRRRLLPRAGSVGVAIGGIVTSLALLAVFDVGGWRDKILGAITHEGIRSIAVLPLANLSGDPEQEYFSDGMTDDLITDLAQIKGLQVISRTSVMHYKDSRRPLPEIARELNVGAVVEGTVRRSGNRVRITTQLIEATTDRHLWARSYERDIEDVMVLEAEVAQTLAREIGVRLTPREKARLGGARRVNPEAQEAFLRSRYNQSFRLEGKTLAYLERAIELEPNYPEAYASMATFHINRARIELASPQESYPRAKSFALKALELDDTLSEAHRSLATVLYDFDWDWEGAGREFRRAIELNPSSPWAHKSYAEWLLSMGRTDEGMAEMHRLWELDPTSPASYANMASAYEIARRDEEAVVMYRQALARSPDDSFQHEYLGECLAHQGKFDDALAEARKALEMHPDIMEHRCALAHVLAMAGMRDEAQAALADLKERSQREFISPVEFAFIYGALGDKDQAFAWLDKAFTDRDVTLPDLKSNRGFDSLRSDPRFSGLLRRMKLPLD